MFKYLILAMLPLAAFAFTDKNTPPRATYASSRRVVPGSNPQEGICVLGGSATRTVRVTQITLSTTQTTAGTNLWSIFKKSNLFPVYTNQGATMLMVPLDLATVSATASSITLSTNASSSGTTIGSIKTFHLFSPVTTTASMAPIVVWDYDRDGSGQPIVLRGATDTIEINAGAAALPAGLAVACGFVWTEE